MTAKTVALAIDKLVLDDRCRSRALGPDPQTVQTYYEAVVDGSASFPPLDVTSDGENYWLTDGRLRLKAFQMAGRSHVECLVAPGTLREARLRAASANATHGLPRTNLDKRQQVWSVLALLDEEEKNVNAWSAQQVAKHCGVSAPLVASLKRLFVEQKAEARKKQEAAEAAALEMASPPDEEAEPSPEAGFLPDPVVIPPPVPQEDDADDEDDDLDDIDRLDEEKTWERAFRALRKVARFAHALGLTLEQLIGKWREAGENTLELEKERQRSALQAKAREKAERDAANPKTPWADD